jgi:hypothetical protein
MNSIHDIQFPSRPTNVDIIETFDIFDKFITDIILYFAYGIALLCGIKFILYILNGFATKPHMGATSMDNSSFFH